MILMKRKISLIAGILSSLLFSFNVIAKDDSLGMFGYTIGSPLSQELKAIDEEDNGQSGHGKNYTFIPKSNSLNIQFDDYVISSDNNNKVIYGIFASKLLDNEKACQKEIEKVKPALVQRFGSPDVISNEVLHFTEGTQGFKAVEIHCASEMLYFSMNDISLNM